MASSAGGGGAASPRLVVSPAALNFGTTGTQATLAATNAGGGTLTIHSVTSDAAWLQVSGSGLGDYTVRVRRNGLAVGTYEGHITFDSSANDVTVTVLMGVQGQAQASRNAGFQYVLLIDVDVPDPVRQVVAQYNVAARDGRYRYGFQQVDAHRRYLVVAGTDLDNDGYICDSGEACGAYPTLDQPVVLTGMRQDLTALDFGTWFYVMFTPNAAMAGTPGPFRGFPVRKDGLPGKGEDGRVPAR